MEDTVAERTPEPPVDLHQLGRELLEEARQQAGTSAITLEPGTPAPHQTVIALTADSALDPEHWNGPASLLVLDGRVRFSRDQAEVTAGSWARLPDDSDVVATQDSCLLLIVGPTD